MTSGRMSSEAQSLDRLLTSASYFADPYPTYARLRSTGPILRSPSLGAWLVTTYEASARILKDVVRFPNSIRIPAFLAQLGPELQEDLAPLAHHFSVGLVQSDPPDHTRLRGQVHAEFARAAIESQREAIQARVDAYIAAVASSGSMDVVADLAYPLPVNVISDMVGIPTADRALYKSWSDRVFGFLGTGRPSVDAAHHAQVALDEMRSYFIGLFDRRLSRPEADLITHLVGLRDHDPDALSEDELLAICGTFVSAGHETTTSLIANGIHALLRAPDQLDRLRAEPSLIGGAVEEILRFESPLQRDMKVAATDVVIDGVDVAAGEPVWVMLGAAHRDPTAFEDPDRFDVGRRGNRHLAFGYGPHFCLGAWLARLEASIAIGTMIERLPNMQFAVDPDSIEWRPDYALRGPRSLPIKFSPPRRRRRQ